MVHPGAPLVNAQAPRGLDARFPITAAPLVTAKHVSPLVLTMLVLSVPAICLFALKELVMTVENATRVFSIISAPSVEALCFVTRILVAARCWREYRHFGERIDRPTTPSQIFEALFEVFISSQITAYLVVFIVELLWIFLDAYSNDNATSAVAWLFIFTTMLVRENTERRKHHFADGCAAITGIVCAAVYGNVLGDYPPTGCMLIVYIVSTVEARVNILDPRADGTLDSDLYVNIESRGATRILLFLNFMLVLASTPFAEDHNAVFLAACKHRNHRLMCLLVNTNNCRLDVHRGHKLATESAVTALYNPSLVFSEADLRLFTGRANLWHFTSLKSGYMFMKIPRSPWFHLTYTGQLLIYPTTFKTIGDYRVHNPMLFEKFGCSSAVLKRRTTNLVDFYKVLGLLIRNRVFPVDLVREIASWYLVPAERW